MTTPPPLTNPVATDQNHDHHRVSDRVEHPPALPQLTTHTDTQCGTHSILHLARPYPRPTHPLLSSPSIPS